MIVLGAQAGALVVKECNNCFVTPDAAPGNPALIGLPGLVNLRQVYDYTPGVTPSAAIILENTAFVDLTSFSGLACSPGFFYLNKNRQLSSLNGLGGLSSPTAATTFVATDNALSGPGSIQAVLNAAGCLGGGTGSQLATMYIQTASCTMQVRLLNRKRNQGCSPLLQCTCVCCLT